MRLKEVNYFGFNHDVVNEKFKGDLTYIRTFTIRGHYWAVYHAARPNRELGHKDYMMLCTRGEGGGMVSGSTPEEMEIERTQEAVLCTKCDTVIYSINRHHFHYCPCGATFVDGGKEYLRRGGAALADAKVVKIDLIDGTVLEMDGLKLPQPLKLDSYYSENDILAKQPVAAKKKRSQSSEKKKRLTPRRKSGKVKSTTKRSTK